MKTTIIYFAALLIACSAAATPEAKPKRPKSGYNYKAHAKRNAKYKKQNESGKKRKCGRTK
jgi:hypothetical protein